MNTDNVRGATRREQAKDRDDRAHAVSSVRLKAEAKIDRRGSRATRRSDKSKLPH